MGGQVSSALELCSTSEPILASARGHSLLQAYKLPTCRASDGASNSCRARPEARRGAAGHAVQASPSAVLATTVVASPDGLDAAALAHASHVAPRGPGLLELPAELHGDAVLSLLGAAQATGRAACASRGLRAALLDATGRLRVRCVHVSQPAALQRCLQRASAPLLQQLRLDLGLAERAAPPRGAADELVARLGEACLAGALRPRLLSLRLASFDAEGSRLRLKSRAWAFLVAGLGALAGGPLESLELSFLPIKMSHLQQPIAQSEPGEPAGEPVTFVSALSRMARLTELRLTYDDIFGDTALELARVAAGLPLLQDLDITRNRISKQALEEMKGMLHARVHVHGSDSQTFAPS